MRAHTKTDKQVAAPQPNTDRQHSSATATTPTTSVIEIRADRHLDTARWEHSLLIHVAYFAPDIAKYYPNKTIESDGWLCEETVYEKVPLYDPNSTYFIAADGDCFALKVVIGSSCIAAVEDALALTGLKQAYITFALKSKSLSALKNWVSKWSKRTTNLSNHWDTSVRILA